MHPNPPRPSPADPRDLTGPFLHEVKIEVRFADTDAMRHVNNAKFLTYCEAGRLQYWTDVAGEGAEGIILAEARITYRAQAYYGETVTVQTRATRIGRTSFTLEHRLVAALPGDLPRLVAVSESVLVRFDYATQSPTPLSDDLIAAIEGFEGRPLR